MLISDNLMFVLCLHLGLNTGKDHTDRQGITILKIENTFYTGEYQVIGFLSQQDPDNLKRLINKPFSIKI